MIVVEPAHLLNSWIPAVAEKPSTQGSLEDATKEKRKDGDEEESDRWKNDGGK
jgi:hypothetical protein